MINIISDALAEIGRQSHKQFHCFSAGLKFFLAKEKQFVKRDDKPWSRYVYIHRHLARRLYDIHFDVRIPFGSETSMSVLTLTNCITFEELREIVIKGLATQSRSPAVKYTEEDIMTFYDFMYQHEFKPFQIETSQVRVCTKPNILLEGRRQELLEEFKETKYSRMYKRKKRPL